MPITFDAEDYLTGRKTASLAPATTGDKARLTPDGSWQSLNDIPLGTEVYEVDHVGQHVSTRGGRMIMTSLNTGRQYELLITGIHLVRASALTPDELAELGHADRASFDAKFGAALGDRRAWFIRVIPHTNTLVQ